MFQGLTTTALVALALIPSAFAHGFVKEVRAGGKSYKGTMTGGGASNPGVVRKINSANPNHIKDASALPCGPGAATRVAAQAVDAKPGMKLDFIWDGGSGNSEWPHEWGPIMNYMAKCSKPGCADNASDLSFYKIDQTGLKPKAQQTNNSGGGKWWLGDISGKKNKGKAVSMTIPQGIANGDYLIRHEIIALHEAENPKMGPEYYPSCIHVKVTGGAATLSVNGAAVKFPAGYTTSAYKGNAHIRDSIFHSWQKQDFIFPGPPVASFGGGGAAAKVVSTKSTADDASTNDDSGDSAETVTVTVTKTVTAAAKATNKKRSRHAVNRLPETH